MQAFMEVAANMNGDNGSGTIGVVAVCQQAPPHPEPTVGLPTNLNR